MSARTMIGVAAVALVLGVGIGALGAHALRGRLGDLLPVFQTAVQYHLVHGLGLLGIGILALHWTDARRALAAVAALLVAGLVLFSGSLYVYALTGARAVAIVTPLGGVAWLVAWLLLAWISLRR